MSEIEQDKISGQDVVARYAAALGGRLHHAIHFDDWDIAAIAQHRHGDGRRVKAATGGRWLRRRS